MSLLVLFFLYIIQKQIPTTHASSSLLGSPSNAHPKSTSIITQECTCQNQRTTQGIIWNCLVTLFACSWVSVHPNVPPPNASWMKRSLRRMELMLWSIVFPELIIYWATKQWTAARRLAQKYCKYGWARTHGHFIQMGGIMLYDLKKNPLEALTPHQLSLLHAAGKIAIPTIDKNDIEDRSKADGLSKALVVIQTSWFIVQCIARKAEGLIITQLELATVALAALNGVLYFLWWNKPQDVQSTIPIFLVPQSSLGIPDDSEHEAGQRQEVQVESQYPTPLQIQAHRTNSTPPRRSTGTAPLRIKLVLWAVFIFRYSGLSAFFKRLLLIITGGEATGQKNEKEYMHVPTFYADEDIPDWLLKGPITIFSCTFGIVFGAIHCTGWHFFFPSKAEADIWRISSTLLAGIPALSILATLIDLLRDKVRRSSLVNVVFYSVGGVIAALLPFYLLARVALLVEAFISLRDLPPDALAVVEWTLFIPHLGIQI